MTTAQKYFTYSRRWVNVDIGWVPGHGWQTGLSHMQRDYHPGWRGICSR